jgi:hypothetical protein
MKWSRVAGLAGVLVATPALAQGWLTIEASADNGATWTTQYLEVGSGQGAVMVRVKADWVPELGYALSQARFDLMVRDARPGDAASDFVRPPPFTKFPQSIVASRFGSTIKIDDSRDTLPPGAGQRAIYTFQDPEFRNAEFCSNRPATVFSCELTLDGTRGVRVIDAIILLSLDDTLDMYVWTDFSGGYRILECTDNPLTIDVVCDADFDGNDQVDFFDYLDFVAAFAEGDPRADFDRNGQVDFFDYLDFVQAFSDGC